MYKNVPAALTLHWTDGFLLKPFASPTYVFNYNFSQLKGSSDDGNATLTLNFQDPVGSNNFVEQVSILSKLLETHKFLQKLLKNILFISGDNLPQTSRIALFHARLFDGQSRISRSCFHVKRKFSGQSANVILHRKKKANGIFPLIKTSAPFTSILNFAKLVIQRKNF